MRTPSIRRALLIRCGIGVGVLLVTLSLVVYSHVSKSLSRELNRSVRGTASLLSDQIELENGVITHEWQEGIRPKAMLPGGELFEFWDETNDITIRSPGMHGMDLPRFSGLDGVPEFRSILLPDGSRARALGLRVFPFVLPEEVEKMEARGAIVDPKSFPHLLVVAESAEPNIRTLERLASVLIIGNLCALGLGYLVIDRVVCAALKPIDELAMQVTNRAEHQLDDALEVPGKLPSELGELAHGFDALLSRVAAIRHRERDFIRHAAHELRTPIAGLQATTDLALSKPREAEEYVKLLKTCHKTALDLGELVKRLSALAQIGKSQAMVFNEPVDFSALLEEGLRLVRGRAEARGLVIRWAVPSERLRVMGDPPLLQIILNNLLDNAVSYASDGGEIVIHSITVEGWLEIVFGNPTLTLPEDLDRLFEPLFRQETSRHDAGGHLGIGLTLSLDAARAMGAALQCRKGEGGDVIEFVLRVKAV
jgi:signal transduction histidine kinase